MKKVIAEEFIISVDANVGISKLIDSTLLNMDIFVLVVVQK